MTERAKFLAFALAWSAWTFVLVGQPAQADRPDDPGIEGVSAAERRNAVTLFGAQLTDNKWKEIATLDDVRMRDAYLLGIGLSREIAGGETWALEVEGHTTRHFGAEDLWEFNGLMVGRWRGLPWREHVPTSLAFGAGPGYATRVPAEEIAMSGSSNRLLIYWMAEVEVGLPDEPWSLLARLHHRSNGYGVVAENGGSNWLTLGVRRRF